MTQLPQHPDPYGAPQPGPAPQPADDGRRGTIWVLVGCGGCTLLAVLLAAALILVLVLRGGPEDPTGPTPTEPTAAQTVGPDGDRGSPDAPLPAGTTVVVPLDAGTMDVRIGEISWDAQAELEELDSSLKPPAEGLQYVVVPVHYTYHGEGEADPVFDVTVTYLDASGEEHTLDPAVTEHSILDAGSVADGESTRWDMAFQVPTDSVGTGGFEIAPLFDYEEKPYYVAAA